MRITETILSRVSAVEANRLAYKDMNMCYYVTATLTVYGLAILVAILIDDISKVFDFVGAISSSAQCFIFPSWFYLGATKQFGGANSGLKCSCYCFIVIGFLNFVLGIYAAIDNILKS